MDAFSELIIGDLSHSAVFDNSKVRGYVPGFAPTRTFKSHSGDKKVEAAT